MNFLKYNYFGQTGHSATPVHWCTNVNPEFIDKVIVAEKLNTVSITVQIDVVTIEVGLPKLTVNLPINR